MNKKIITGMLGVFLVLMAMTGVFAYMGNPAEKGDNFTEERHEAMEEAFEDGDYGSWYELMTENGRKPGITRVVNEDNFDEFVGAREAALEGDISKLQEFRESLGLGQGRMKNSQKQASRGRGNGNCPFA